MAEGMMDVLTKRAFNNAHPGAKVSCRECGSEEVEMTTNDGMVSASNPLGMRQFSVRCMSCCLIDQADDDGSLRKVMEAWAVSEVRLYTCYYEFDGIKQRTSSDSGIECFIYGFWINKKGEITEESKGQHWIPPGKINHVTVSVEVKRLSE